MVLAIAEDFHRFLFIVRVGHHINVVHLRMLLQVLYDIMPAAQEGKLHVFRHNLSGEYAAHGEPQRLVPECIVYIGQYPWMPHENHMTLILSPRAESGQHLVQEQTFGAQQCGKEGGASEQLLVGGIDAVQDSDGNEHEKCLQ